MTAAAALAALTSAVACGGDSDPLPTVFGGDRPVELRVPSSYDPDTAAPLLMVLHGYSINGAVEAGYTRLADLTTDGVFVLAPDGTEDLDGNLYWNAEHPGCGVGEGTERPDDVGYLLGLIDEVAAVYTIDAARVYLFGHSNGGFMAYRLVCDHPDRFAAMISLAGAPPLDADACAPSEAVSVAQIHGDADDTVLYGGGDQVVGIACPYPPATETIARFAAHNGCGAALADTGARIDFESTIDGSETRVEHHADCTDGVATELWTMEGGGHVPALRPDAYRTMWAFLAVHTRP